MSWKNKEDIRVFICMLVEEKCTENKDLKDIKSNDQGTFFPYGRTKNLKLL
jgi:hypothetical protein